MVLMILEEHDKKDPMGLYDAIIMLLCFVVLS